MTQYHHRLIAKHRENNLMLHYDYLLLMQQFLRLFTRIVN